MVSRVYNPVYPNRSVNRPSEAAESDISREEAAKVIPNASTAPLALQKNDNFDRKAAQRVSDKDARPNLATLRDQAAGKPIQLDSILADFEQTLNALGLKPEAQQQLQPYLNVVRLQGQESKPDIALIKSTLLSASKTLDGWIEKATQNPSDVVSEWMKTLLGQSVNYTSKQSVTPPNPPYAGSVFSGGQAHADASVADKQMLMNWLASAKRQDATKAIPLLQQALQHVPANQPEWANRIQTMLAKRCWQTGDHTQALHWLDSASAVTTDPVKQNRQRALLGYWHGRLGQHDKVIQTLGPLLQSPLLQPHDKAADTLGLTTTARVWLDYGTALVKQNQNKEAIPALQQAVQRARQLKQGEWLAEALPPLATAYLQDNNPTAAFQVLKRHQQLRLPG